MNKCKVRTYIADSCLLQLENRIFNIIFINSRLLFRLAVLQGDAHCVEQSQMTFDSFLPGSSILAVSFFYTYRKSTFSNIPTFFVVIDTFRSTKEKAPLLHSGMAIR